MSIDIGIYPDLSNEDYHKDPALSSSMMSLLKRNPSLMKYNHEHPIEPTPAMKFGAEYHGYVLGTSKDVSKTNVEIITDMYDVLKNHPIASKLLSGGEPEVSYFWQHKKYIHRSYSGSLMTADRCFFHLQGRINLTITSLISIHF